MKHITTILLLVITSNFAFSQGKNKATPSITFDVKHNGKTHTVAVGDTVHIGLGGHPYGSFMYMEYGAGQALPKDLAGKTAVITKIKYVKSFDAYRVFMKAGKLGFLSDGLEQAIAKKEILGINQTFFD
jgi:hypothetical protein